MDSARIESELRDFFSAPAHGVAAAWLFGSVARGTARPDSDVDVAVLLAEDPPAGLDGLRLDLEGEIERRLGVETQLVVVNSAPPDLIHRVLMEGRLLCEHDASARIRFEVRSRNEYWDLLPYLEEYRRRNRAS